MPELPEVETVGRSLAPFIVGQTFVNIEVFALSLRTPLDGEKMSSFLLGEKIISWKRRGKYLLFHLESGKFLILHLGMTGSCRICSIGAKREKHEHIIWTLSGDISWRFSDIRRFGQVWLINSEESFPLVIQNLGVEPLEKEFTADYFYRKIRQDQRSLKIVLLDQSLIAGLGNIYVNEALWLAKLFPEKKASSTTKKQIKILVQAIKQVLLKAVECGGTTISDFRRPDGSEGKFVLELKVYGKTGEKCSICQSLIERHVVGGRSTWYCPYCQKK